MSMHNPPHPGEFIRSIYLEPFGMSARALAASLAVARDQVESLRRLASVAQTVTQLRYRVLGAKPSVIGGG